MRVCAIDYNGPNMMPVVLEGSADQWMVVDLEPRRIPLNDLWDTEEVRLFLKTVTAFFAEHGVDRVVIKKRATGGKFGGGAASFRMGALVQVSTEKPVDFISPQAVAAALKGEPVTLPESLRKYQQSAFEVGMAFVRRGGPSE